MAGKVITVMNMKGGVGKTTLAINLSGVIAYRRWAAFPTIKKVLMIDYDPQFNLSQTFLPPKDYFDIEEARKTTLAILTDDDAELNPYELQVPGNHNPPSVTKLRSNIAEFSDGGRIDIIPSTLDLMYLALGQTSHQIKPIEERFAKFVSECREHYDLILIDCHPAGSLFTKTSLRNSDVVLIPVIPDQRYSVRGIGLMLNFIEAKNHGNKGPRPLIIFNRTSRIGISAAEATIRANQSYGKYCMKNTLKKYGAFAEPEGGKGFVWASSKPYSQEALRNLQSVAYEFMDTIK
jgi:chromosome partitioning protein